MITINKFVLCTILALVIAFHPCLGQTETIGRKSQNNPVPNTKFVIHYKNASDMTKHAFYTRLTEYQVINLEDFPANMLEVPGAIMKDDGLTRTWHFYMASPLILNMGFTTVYVEPSDSVDLTYEQLGMDQYRAPITKIDFNTLNSFILRYGNGIPSYAKPDYQKSLYEIATKTDIDKYFRLKYLDSLSSEHTQTIFSVNPKFIENTRRSLFINDIMLQINFNNLVAAFKARLTYFNGEEQEDGIKKLQDMYRIVSKRILETNRNSIYYFCTKNIFTLCYEKDWENQSFSYNSIYTGLKEHDTLTQQYLFLLILKNDMSELQKDQANLKRINEAVTNPEFRKYADKYLALKVIGKTGEGYLSNELRNIPVYNTGLKKVSFGDVFERTKQSYLYLDFCGSWCAPCLKEIVEYAKSKREFDNSTKTRPVWLFFENNKEAWLKVIEKYHLKKENCFLVMDNKLQNLFSPKFGWQGEFPHHFLFSRDGRIVEEKAPPLINLDENSIPNKSSVNMPPPLR